MGSRSGMLLFDLEGIPRGEHESAHHVCFLLYNLDKYVEDFLSALLLFDNALPLAERANRDLQKSVRRWMFLAARDGAMTIFHFGKALHVLRSSLGKVPIFRANVDVEALRQCARDFDSAFPLYVEIRNAIAHAGEMLHAEKQKQHALVGEVDIPGYIKGNFTGGLNLNSNIMGREFGYSFEGAHVSYSVSQESHQKLLEIKNRAYDAFSGVLRS